ncbi:uncharacterized protein LOC133782845 isoform X2 [Humulus lupulus]|nr:uncharacterized protein LOC133782845 isoform X2 [Humulus lupulus]
MSAVADGRDLTGLTLDDILAVEKRAVHNSSSSPRQPHAPPIPAVRTLLDIIRDEDPKSSSCKGFAASRDKKSWKSFKDRLRLKRSGSGAAWTSSVHTPTSDILIPNSRSQVFRHNSARERSLADSAHDMNQLDGVSADTGGHFNRPQISRRSSTRFGAANIASFRYDGAPNDEESEEPRVPSLRHTMSRRHSTRYSSAMVEDSSPIADPTEPSPREGSRRLSVILAEERSLSAREAVAAQEAAEAEAAAAAAAAGDEAETTGTVEEDTAPEADSDQPVRMSLMDLLEETDRQMGFVGSRYMIGDEDEEGLEEEEDDDDEEVEEVKNGGVVAGGVEKNCCVCMVRHKGAAFIPCGHTFCRLCSRELWVSRGNCPLCNGFILEILDIF